MNLGELHPYVYYATRYPFSKGQTSESRLCYSASLYLISEGKGRVISNGASYEAVPGSLVYIPAGQKHDWIADDTNPMVHICCYFDWTFQNHQPIFSQPHFICHKESDFQMHLQGSAFPFPIPVHTVVEKPWVWVKYFENFYTSNEYTNEKTYLRNLKVQQHFHKFIEFFLTRVMKSEHIPDPRISKLLGRLEQDLAKGHVLPLDVYISKLKMSRGYFFELFKQTTGMSPLQYMNLYRINHAKEDLQFSNLSITRIAEKHHFSSVHYFSKLFRQLTGKTPTEYRS